MASSPQSLYPFIISSDDGCHTSVMPTVNNVEPITHTDNADNQLISQVESKMSSIAASAAETANLHTDVIYNRMLPIDILIFGRSGIGKSCLLKAITNDPNIETSPQLDHVTKELGCFVKKIGKLTFRFWDTKGIDTWTISEDVGRLLNDICRRNIQPLFVIYCSSCSGRVDSEVVTKILNCLKGTKTPIAYVITNIYSHSNEQLQGQIDGGLRIMEEVYLKNSVQKNKYYYEFGVLTDTNGSIIRDGKGILIAINSEPYRNDLTNTNKPKLNLFELMWFIGNNLNDEDFVRFVALTIQNRSYWEQISDNVRTKLYQCRDKLTEYGIRVQNFVWDNLKNLFKSDNEQ